MDPSWLGPPIGIKTLEPSLLVAARAGALHGGPYTTLTRLEPDATLQFPHQTSREPLSEQVLE